VKTLPDSPNLDHLRQQAKDLLAGLRDSRPETSLAQAQAALATQYGFATWTELKAEVDRRHGGGEVAGPALAREIASRFGLGEVTGPMRSVARSDEMGRRWSLTTDQGRWLARTMDTWIPIVDVETEIALQEAVAAAGVLVPAPVRSRSGSIIEAIGSHPWRVCEWMHSGPPLAAPVSAAITYEVGRILATIHGLGLPVDRVSPWHARRLSSTPWSQVAGAAQARQADWAPRLVEMVPILEDLDAIGETEPTSAPVLSHNTLGPENVRVGPGGRLVVLDWEHAGGQPPDWELGDTLMIWTIEAGSRINVAGVHALLDGYRSVAGSLPPLELSMFSGAASSFSNYVFGEISTALQASDEEDRQHADRSVRHLLSIVPGRQLLEQLLGTTRTLAGGRLAGRVAGTGAAAQPEGRGYSG
jgi:Ser/Thr protein kinase RdoA (MazF antagonist)